METRILLEVEVMIQRIQEQQGRSFDIKQLIMSSVVNVVMDMAFGHRFDHSCREFQRLIADSNELFSDIPVELEIFPVLCHMPYYKKKVAHNVATMKRISDYINVEIAACREVCHKQKQVLPKVIWESRIATTHGREWTRPLRLLAVQCPLQTSPVTQSPVCATPTPHRHTTAAYIPR